MKQWISYSFTTESREVSSWRGWGHLDTALQCTVEHAFNGHEVNGIQGVNGKKFYDRAFHLVNKLHDFNGMHDLSGNFCYDDFFRKTHERLYLVLPQ